MSNPILAFGQEYTYSISNSAAVGKAIVKALKNRDPPPDVPYYNDLIFTVGNHLVFIGGPYNEVRLELKEYNATWIFKCMTPKKDSGALVYTVNALRKAPPEKPSFLKRIFS
jgi:hypothetical protein